jgi:hypothetical protein
LAIVINAHGLAELTICAPAPATATASPSPFAGCPFFNAGSPRFGRAQRTLQPACGSCYDGIFITIVIVDLTFASDD